MAAEADAFTNAQEKRETRVIGRPFVPGQIPNPAGRPKGSRNKLGEDFVSALYEDFQTHGIKAIEAVRADKPAEYLKVIASLLPKEIKISDDRDLSDDELDKRIRLLALALDLEITSLQRPLEITDRTEAAERSN